MEQMGRAKICLENYIFLKDILNKNIDCTLSKPAKERAAQSAEAEIFLSAFIDGQFRLKRINICQVQLYPERIYITFILYIFSLIIPLGQRKITFQINIH